MDLAQRDVLHHRDQEERLARGTAHGRGDGVAPHVLAGARVPELGLVFGRLTAGQRAQGPMVAVVAVHQAHELGAHQAVLGAPEHGLQSRVGLDDAAVQAEAGDADGGPVEDGAEATLALLARGLGLLALGDVLDHRVVELRFAVGVADQADGDVAPEAGAVLLQIAPLQAVAVDLAGAQPVEKLIVEVEVVGVDETAWSEAAQLGVGVPEELTAGPVHPGHPPVQLAAGDDHGRRVVDRAQGAFTGGQVGVEAGSLDGRRDLGHQQGEQLDLVLAEAPGLAAHGGDRPDGPIACQEWHRHRAPVAALSGPEDALVPGLVVVDYDPLAAHESHAGRADARAHRRRHVGAALGIRHDRQQLAVLVVQGDCDPLDVHQLPRRVRQQGGQLGGLQDAAGRDRDLVQEAEDARAVLGGLGQPGGLQGGRHLGRQQGEDPEVAV